MNPTENKITNPTNSLTSNSTDINALTKKNSTKSNAIQFPDISIPKGGGTLTGIDKKFEVNAAEGIAGFTIPIPIIPDIINFTPSINLSYNSGSDNNFFCIGWAVALPSI